MDDYFGDTSDEKWSIPEHTVIPMKDADNVNRTVTNRNNNRGRCSVPESENDTTSNDNSRTIDWPFTKLSMAGAGIKTDSLGGDYAKCGEIPVTQLIPVGVLNTYEHLVMRVSILTVELSGVEQSSYSETEFVDSPVVQEYVCPELLVKNYRRNAVKIYMRPTCCFGLCGMTDSLSRPELCWCWDCVD